LSGLVLFQQITGFDVHKMGNTETAAAQLGIPATVAVQLQQVARQAVTQENSAPVNPTLDPCTVSKLSGWSIALPSPHWTSCRHSRQIAHVSVRSTG
jgi:hypothetical protein